MTILILMMSLNDNPVGIILKISNDNLNEIPIHVAHLLGILDTVVTPPALRLDRSDAGPAPGLVGGAQVERGTTSVVGLTRRSKPRRSQEMAKRRS